MQEKEIKTVVSHAVKETLVTLGIDVSNPMEMQQDLHFLRRFRESVGKIVSKVGLVTVGVLATGTIGALWLGIKALLCK